MKVNRNSKHLGAVTLKLYHRESLHLCVSYSSPLSIFLYLSLFNSPSVYLSLWLSVCLCCLSTFLSIVCSTFDSLNIEFLFSLSLSLSPPCLSCFYLPISYCFLFHSCLLLLLPLLQHSPFCLFPSSFPLFLLSFLQHSPFRQWKVLSETVNYEAGNGIWCYYECKVFN